MCQNSLTIRYKGYDGELRQILSRARGELEKVFENNYEKNRLILGTFTSSQIFAGKEAFEIMSSLSNSVAFAETLCTLLLDRYELLPVINKFLNLNDQDYRTPIRRIFLQLLDEELVRENSQDTNNRNEELEQFLKAPHIIVELELDYKQPDTASSFPKFPMILAVISGIFIFVQVASSILKPH